MSIRPGDREHGRSSYLTTAQERSTFGIFVIPDSGGANGVVQLPHPVLRKIDRANPCFTRKLTRRCADGDRECELQIWLPVQLDNGGWVSAVHITNLDLPSISAMPGEDPLDALLRAVAFARDVVEREDGGFLFGYRQREGAGLPISLDRGFPPGMLAELEARALALADDAASSAHGHLMVTPPDR